MTVTAYPLCWPAGKPRTSHPQPSRFGTNKWQAARRISMADAQRELFHQLALLGAENEILSSNLKLRKDGLPYSNQRTPDDPGIAVYFDLHDSNANLQTVCIACDKWNKQECNVWSIAKSIDALRGLERWGGGEMVQAAFTGFVALPAPAAAEWWSVLEFYSEGNALESDVEMRCRELMQKYHPDKGGDEWRFNQIVKARSVYRRLHGKAA